MFEERALGDELAIVQDRQRIGVREFRIDGQWGRATTLKAAYGPSIADAYADTVRGANERSE